jgi:hypothetical protein
MELTELEEEVQEAIIPEARRPPREEGVTREKKRRPMEADDEDDREPDRPRRRPRRQRSNPYAAVKGPALGLLICGYAGLAINLVSIILNVILIASGPSPAPGPGGRGGSGEKIGFIAGQITGGLVLTAIWAGAVIKGANSFQSMNGYGTAVVGCIMAMIPCSLGCLGGLPIGIWGLIVLLQDDVKRAFD